LGRGRRRRRRAFNDELVFIIIAIVLSVEDVSAVLAPSLASSLASCNPFKLLLSRNP